LTTDAFMIAASGMEAHINLMKEKVDDGRNNVDRALGIIGKAMNTNGEGVLVDDEDEEDED